MLKAKDMYNGSPSYTLGPRGKVELSYVHLSLGEAKPLYLNQNSFQCFITSPVSVLCNFMP